MTCYARPTMVSGVLFVLGFSAACLYLCVIWMAWSMNLVLHLKKYNHVWCIEDSENGMVCFTTSKREH